MQKKRYAVLTGASRGIGRALAMAMASRGWDMAVCSRDAVKLKALSDEIQAMAPNVTIHTMPCDMGQAEQVTAFGKAVQDWFPHVDALVHNAGIFRMGSILDEAEGDLEAMWRINVASAYALTRALVPAMIERGQGDVVTLCSIASFKAYPAGGSYGITKHALLGFTRNLREELRQTGVRVCAVMPGATLTDSWAEADVAPERLMPPEDIAASILHVLELSPRTVVEEIVLRPQLGDL